MCGCYTWKLSWARDLGLGNLYLRNTAQKGKKKNLRWLRVATPSSFLVSSLGSLSLTKLSFGNSLSYHLIIHYVIYFV